MPIYEFSCSNCKIIVEKCIKIENKSIINCPDCGQKMKKLISPTSFILKGPGWAKDGYTNKKKSVGDKNGNGPS